MEPKAKRRGLLSVNGPEKLNVPFREKASFRKCRVGVGLVIYVRVILNEQFTSPFQLLHRVTVLHVSSCSASNISNIKRKI